MNNRPSRKKMQFFKNGQDIDRSFVLIPEVVPSHWRENLDRFFDENETGLDQVRYMMDMSRTDIDRYYFTGGYEIYQPLPHRPDAALRSKQPKAPATRLGSFTMTYGANGCFRYALPE